MIPLEIDGFIEEMSRVLQKAAAKGVVIRTRGAGMDLYAMANREELARVFSSLAGYGNDAVGGRGSLTMAGRLLPVQTDGRYCGNGCLLLSFRCTSGGQGEGSSKSERPAGAAKGRERLSFPAIRAIVERHHGSFRIIMRWGETDFNVYLPLLPRTWKGLTDFGPGSRY